ncbi:unnamed protein product [Calypogeia fissa]
MKQNYSDSFGTFEALDHSSAGSQSEIRSTSRSRGGIGLGQDQGASMEGTNEETRLLEERRSLLSGQREGSPMPHVFRSNFFLLIGLCSILGLVWLGCRYDIFEAIWNLRPVERSEYHDLRTGWQDGEVAISIVESALESGAVCLDGSPPAYFLDRGSGEGANNWVVFHQGGGWCYNADNCLQRSYTQLGSSTKMPRRGRSGGILSSTPNENPDFYNWNRVLLPYCDGSSFTGDVSDPIEVGLDANPLINGTTPVANIFLRGQRIWTALMEDLMEKGMKNAEKALLAGCSAGGLATMLHCDQYRDLMPKTTVVKCLSDAGFFLDIPDVSGVQTMETNFGYVVQFHSLVDNLPKYCTSEGDVARCLFPEYIIPGLKTPLFVLNSGYDSTQIGYSLVPSAADPNSIWDECKSSLLLCSAAQLNVLQGFWDSFLEKLLPLLEEKDCAFIDSCYVHVQAQVDSMWNGPRSPKIDNKTMATVVGDWYFERNSTKVVDCPYPGNPTCVTEP